MNAPSNISGQKFFRLTPIEICGRNKFDQILWRCACDCGGEIKTLVQRLRSGATKSCGCWNREVAAERAFARSYKHGHSSRAVRSPEYISWAAMHGRCRYASVNSFEAYGGRGISVCERWNDFETFLADMGPKPTPVHSIDRIDSDGNYEPSNCRWATAIEQRHNRRDDK